MNGRSGSNWSQSGPVCSYVTLLCFGFVFLGDFLKCTLHLAANSSSTEAVQNLPAGQQKGTFVYKSSESWCKSCRAGCECALQVIALVWLSHAEAIRIPEAAAGPLSLRSALHFQPQSPKDVRLKMRSRYHFRIKSILLYKCRMQYISYGTHFLFLPPESFKDKLLVLHWRRTP